MRPVLLIFVAWACQAQVHVNACTPGDSNFTGGACYASPIPIPAGAPSYLQQERYGNFSYHFPMADGQYTVSLHFIENSTAITGVGQRQFNVAINGAQVLAAFDLAGAGLNTPVDRSFPVLAAGGTGVTITFTTVLRNAVVSAIDVTGPPAPTWLSGSSALPPSCMGLSWYFSTAVQALWFCPSPAQGWQSLAWIVAATSAAGIRTVAAADGTLFYLVDQSGNR